MQTKQVIEFFGGTQQKAADAIGVGQSDIAKWLKKGVPPYLRQLQIQVITKGKLKAIPEPLTHRLQPKKAKRMCETAPIQATGN
jgi:hypothetical protein